MYIYHFNSSMYFISEKEVCRNIEKKKGRKMKMSVEKSLISGSTSMLLLKLLSEKDMYGYEMIETLEKRSNHVFHLKAGTLYPLLHSMEIKGWLNVYENQVNGKVRKYYTITKEGKKYLKGKGEEWEEYVGAVRKVMGGGSIEGV